MKGKVRWGKAMENSGLYSKREPKICTSVANTWSPFSLERGPEEEKHTERLWGKGVGKQCESCYLRYHFLTEVLLPHNENF